MRAVGERPAVEACVQSKRLTAGLSHLPSSISFELKGRLRATTPTGLMDGRAV